ncbi:MAG TPA: LytTR family DNA-binding domain-containing protein [Bacteroidota bacterium]
MPAPLPNTLTDRTNVLSLPVGRKLNTSLSLVGGPLSPTPAPQPRQILLQNRLMVKSGGRIMFLRPEEIDWIAAQGDYVCLHVQDRKYLVRTKIGDLELTFAPDRFVRIHRSTLVAIDRIKEFQPLLYGEYVVTLLDGTKLTMSRSHRASVFRRLKAGDA